MTSRRTVAPEVARGAAATAEAMRSDGFDLLRGMVIGTTQDQREALVLEIRRRAQARSAFEWAEVVDRSAVLALLDSIAADGRGRGR